MIQRVALISIISLLLVAIFSIFFIFSKQNNAPQTDTLGAVPINTEIICHTQNCEKLFKLLTDADKTIIHALFNLDKTKEIFTQLAVIDTLTKQNIELRNFFEKRELTIAISVKGKQELSVLYILPVENSFDKKVIKETIATVQKDYNFTLRKRTFNETDLYSLNNQQAKDEFTYCFTENLFLVSASSLLLEDAVLQLSTSMSITNDKDFMQLKTTTSSESKLHCFINHKNFPHLVSSYFSRGISNFIKKNTFSSWTALDLDVLDNHLILNGLTNYNLAENNFLQILSGQEVMDVQIEEVIPSNCVNYAILTIENPKNFREDYTQYLEKTGDIHTYNKTNYRWNKKAGTNVASFFDNLLKNEMAAVFLEDVTKEQAENSYFVMKTQGRSFTKQQLKKLLKKYAKQQETTLENYITNYWIDKNTRYTFYRLPFEDVAYQLWGRMFKDISTNYVTLYDNYLIAAHSKAALRKYIYQNLLRKTLNHDEFYKQHKKYISDKNTNFSVYFNLTEGLDWAKSFFNDKNKKFIDKHKKELVKFQCLSYHLSKTDNFLYNHIYFSYNANIEPEPETNWQSRLDAGIDMKPALVTSHLTNDKEILIQDKANKLYLIDSSGLIIWKNKLNEKINSEVFQVDYFKNNKLQYLFSTESQLHLIDRNGNYVERYPVNLKVRATSGMALFDYEKDQNYRIFIPGNDRNIYAYDLEGNIVSGWQVYKTDYWITSPLQHVRLGTKDYILCGDKSRTYILDRRGNERVILNENYGKSTNNGYTLDKANKRVISTAPNGLIIFNYFDGSVSVQHIDNFSEEHYFIAQDLNNDKEKDFIFVDENHLRVFNSKGKKLFDKQFEKPIRLPPRLYEMSYNVDKIGITAGNHIYLFDSKGKQHPGFPLQGKTNFTIGLIGPQSKHYALFVAGKENLLYNYTLK